MLIEKEEMNRPRREAARRLKELGKEAQEAVPMLIESIKDEDDEVRKICCEALQEMGLPLKLFVELGKKNSLVLAKALERQRQPESVETATTTTASVGIVPMLLPFLNHPDREVVNQAAQSLSLIYHPSAKSAVRIKDLLNRLINAIESRQEGNSAVQESLGRIVSKFKDQAPNELMTIYTDAQYPARKAILETIGVVSDSQVMEFVFAKLSDKDINIRKSAAVSLGKIGTRNKKEVVGPLLAKINQGKGKEQWHEAAQSLGEIKGWDTKNSVKPLNDLTEKLRIEGRDDTIALSIAEIVQNVIEAKDKEENEKDWLRKLWLSIQQSFSSKDAELHELLVKKASQELQGGSSAEYIKARQLISLLEIRIQPQWPAQIKETTLRSRKIQALILLPLIWGVLFFFWPLRLLWLLFGDEINPQVLILRYPLSLMRKIALVGFPERVLDSWIREHVENGRRKFREMPEVEKRAIYVNSSVEFTISKNEKVIHERLQFYRDDATDDEPRITPEVQEIFDNRKDRLHQAIWKWIKRCLRNNDSSARKERLCLVISGEGANGKSSLAFQMARSAMEGDPAYRLCADHQMLPVLIASDFRLSQSDSRSQMLVAIGEKLAELVGRPASSRISEDLLAELLRKRRILVLIDGHSYMDNPTRDAILQHGPDMASVFIVTTRLDEWSKRTRIVLQTKGIIKDSFVSFTEQYQAQKRLANNALKEISKENHIFQRLSFAEGTIPINIAKTCADILTSDDENHRVFSQVMLHLVKDDHEKHGRARSAENTIYDHDMLKAVKLAAWECTKDNYRAQTVDQNRILASFGKVYEDAGKAGELLNYLKCDLQVLREVLPGVIGFSFPLKAESIAALYLFENLSKRKKAYPPKFKKWLQDFEHNALFATQGFYPSPGFLHAMFDGLDQWKKDDRQAFTEEAKKFIQTLLRIQPVQLQERENAVPDTVKNE